MRLKRKAVFYLHIFVSKKIRDLVEKEKVATKSLKDLDCDLLNMIKQSCPDYFLAE